MAAEEIIRACERGDVDEVERLLPRVRNPADVRGDRGETLLHFSCRHGWLDVTRRLVEQYHCNPAQVDDTPLHEACREGHVGIVRYLVREQGCSTVCQNRYGNTPLHEACLRDQVDIVRWLISEQGCSTVHQNKDGNTPLLEACKTGRLAVVEILLTAQDCSTACIPNIVEFCYTTPAAMTGWM